MFSGALGGGLYFSFALCYNEFDKSVFEEVLQVGFTAWLAIVYVLLIIITAIAFVRKKKVAGIITTAIMVLGIVVLGYLWFTSSM